MPKKMQGQNTSLYWMDILATSVADLPAISLAHWTTDIAANTVTEYSDAIVAGYTVNPTGSDVIDQPLVGDLGNAKQRGLYNYAAKVQFAREADPTTNASSLYEKAYQKFKVRGVRGYWGRRLGKQKGTPVVVGDKLRFFFVESFQPKTLDSVKGNPIWLEVDFGQQGYMSPAPTAVVA